MKPIVRSLFEIVPTRQALFKPFSPFCLKQAMLYNKVYNTHNDPRNRLFINKTPCGMSSLPYKYLQGIIKTIGKGVR